MNIPGYDRAEREWLEPPDDVEEECERCGRLELLSEHKGDNICDNCLNELTDEEE